MPSFQCGLGIGLGVESFRWKGGEFTDCEFHGRIRYVLCWFSDSDSWCFNGRVFVVVLFVIFTTQMFPQFYLVILASVKVVSR